MSVQERGGRTLGQELGTTVPGRSRRRHCQREKCFPCNTGQEGECRRTGLGYEIDCNICNNDPTIISENKYSGETGKNMFMRGSDYVKDVENKRANKPLWNHIIEKHNGVMAVRMFSHFSMRLYRYFRKPQRRKADEGVRIAKLNPNTRMNSKNEFLQGTNIFMQPVRGVGVV